MDIEMVYVLELYSNNVCNIEGVYASKLQAQQKAESYIKVSRELNKHITHYKITEIIKDADELSFELIKCDEVW